MTRRILIALSVVVVIALLLPLLEQPKELEFTAFATIQGQPKIAAKDAEAQYLQALRLSIRNPDEARAILEEIAITNSPFAGSARDLASAIRAAQAEGDDAYTYTQLGQSLARLGAWELSAEALQKAVELQPDYAEAWAYLGEALQQNGDDGLTALQTALDINPLSLSANLFTAIYWQRTGNFLEAHRHLEIAYLQDRSNPQRLIAIAENQVLAGNVVEARDYFLRAIDLQSDNLSSWKSLASYSLVNQIFEEETGLPSALKALSLDRTDAESLYLVGRAYWQMDQDKALVIRFLNAALEQDPQFASAHLILGKLYLVNQDYSLARKHLELVLLYTNMPQEVQQAQSLLLQIP